MTIQVKQNQTIWDIALQYAGSVDATFDILEANGKSHTALLVGESLVVPKVVNKKVAQFFESEASIASSLEPLGVDNFEPTPNNCLPAYYQVLFNGLHLTNGTIGSGQNQPIEVSSFIPEADYTILHNGVDVASGSITAGDNSPIEVAANIPPANFNLTKEGQSVLAGSIPAGQSQTIAIDTYINQWIRSEFWPEIPITADRAYIVWAVFSDAPLNGIELTINANLSVNWGDGTNSTGTGTLNKTYSYSGISADVLQSYDGRSYKPVLISIQVISGNPTEFFTQNTTNTWANNALQVVDRLTNSTGRKRYRLSPTESTLAVTQLNNRSAVYLEAISLNHQLTQSAAALSGMRNCQVFDVPTNFFNLIFSADSLAHLFNRSFKPGRIVFGNTFFGGSSSNLSALFQRAGVWKIGNINMSVSNLITSLFQDSQIEEIGDITFTNITSCQNAFQNTANLIKVGAITIPTGVTNINNMFNGSAVAEIVFVNNLSNVTSATNAFANNGNIRRLVVPGLRLSLDVSRNRMQASALTEMLLLLGNPTTVQNVVIIGNPGSVGFVPPTIHPNWNIIN